MLAIANCTISIYRGTVVDEYGDEIATNAVPVATKVIANIREGGAMPQDLNEQKPRVLRMVEGDVNANQDIRVHDRVVHEQTGRQYWVRYVQRQETSGFTVDTHINLESVD